jgi:glycosyltransferase involved in cell wall biosynthesis
MGQRVGHACRDRGARFGAEASVRFDGTEPSKEGLRMSATRTGYVARIRGRLARSSTLNRVRAHLRTRALRAAVAREESHTYANGVTTRFTLNAARVWQAYRTRPVVVVVLGELPKGAARWVRDIHTTLHAHVLVPAGSAGALSAAKGTFTACDFLADAGTTDLRDVLRWIRRFWRACDVWFVDAANPLPDPWDGVRLQHAAHAYDRNHEIACAAPALGHGTRRFIGVEFDRAQGGWAQRDVEDLHGQHAIPRYVLGTHVHGLLVRSSAVDGIDLESDTLAGLGLADQLNVLVRRAWQQNRRTLAFAPVVLPVSSPPVLPAFTDGHRSWLRDRAVEDADGRRRVIFVLNATSVSGGIRTVFEEAEGLAHRGFAVEIWSLQGQPDWIDLDLPVVSFRSYDDLLMALRNERAIKVATWWETAEIVFLASVNHGIPVDYVQEFETWFYPTQADGRAAVAASYRPEFHTLTTARYQHAELAEVGVQAELIPVGYDPGMFHEDASVERESDAVLALGRSFFQKNFAMTRRAWERLGAERPRLLLFGGEPDIVSHEKAEYVVRPDDDGVRRLYNRATCFVQTSYHEGFSLPILEAMACGCPVITTDSHGNRDFCVDGENCLMVPQDDDAALAEAMRRLVADEELQDRLRAAGLRTAERYRWDAVLAGMAEYYAGVA